MKKLFPVVLAVLLSLWCASGALAEEVSEIVFRPNGIRAAETKYLRVSGNTVTIRDKGTYVFSGELENGQIVVDAGGKDTVTIILNGVTLTNATAPVLLVENASLTILRLAAGTENTLVSGEAVDVLEAGKAEAAEGGAIHAKDSLRIEGDGSLTVGGYLNNGIHTSNNLTIFGGNIAVEAVNHGIKGKDSVLIEGGSLTVTSGKDGVTSDDTAGEGYGVVTIRGGSLTVNAAGDGIQAETRLDISGGVLDITSGGGSAGVEYDDPDDWGGWRRGGFGWDEDFGEDADSAVSTKGLKSGGALTVSGGTITVDAADDAVHANGTVSVTGGTMTLSSGDDGIHADTALTVEDGAIAILASYEGMEANQILLAGGVIDITSADDGLNAYGGEAFGMGRGGFGGRGGHGGFGGRGAFGGPGGSLPEEQEDSASDTPEDRPVLRITGGTIHINAEGDGLDSNGSIIVEGGDVVVDGPFRSMNGAIDAGTESGGTCEVHGGRVLAIGAAGMADTFGSTSTQCAFQVTVQGVSAGDEIVITDSRGIELMRHTALKAFASVVFTSPELTIGETYTVTAGGQSVQITLDSVSTGGQPMRRGW